MKLTKEQYETLVKMLYVANWMIEEDESTDANSPYLALEQHVLSQAKDYDMADDVEYDEESRSYSLNEEYVEGTDVFEIIENYDDALVFSRLAGHFASIDAQKAGKMSEAELEEKESEIAEEYFDLFADKGLDCLSVKK